MRTLPVGRRGIGFWFLLALVGFVIVGYILYPTLSVTFRSFRPNGGRIIGAYWGRRRRVWRYRLADARQLGAQMGG
jgi:hypothetical protein